MFTAALCFLQFRCDNRYRFSGRYGSSGVLDLRGDEGAPTLSVLTYGWEFYPQKLLMPGEFLGQEPAIFHLFGAGYWSYRFEDGSFYLFPTALSALHCRLCGIKGRPKKLVLTAGAAAVLLSLTVPPLFLGGRLNAMLIYSAFLGGIKLLLFGWMIATAVLTREQTKSMNRLLLAGLCGIASALLAQEAVPLFEPVRFGWPTENAGFLFILLLASGIWFDTVNAYAGRAALAENVRLMKRQFSLQEENYGMISQHFEETRRMRHDLRHHLNAIAELAQQKRYPELEAYLKGCGSTAAPSVQPVLCENQAAGAVLTYYQQLAKEKEVPLTLRVSLPSALKLEGWNLGILFGNLIENAIEASTKIPPENRSVKVYSKIEQVNLLICVKNKWNKEFSAEKGHIRSTKHSGYGIGLASVRELVEKQGGQFYLTPGEEDFEVSLILWRQVEGA